MRILRKRWPLVAAALACYVACAWYFGGDVQASRKVNALARPAELGKDKKPLKSYYGAAACSNKGCHGGEPPAEWIEGKELLVRNTESLIWNKCDKHGLAYKALTSARGKQMSRILKYDVTKAKACLVCHSVWIDDPKVLAKSKQNKFKFEEGVTCVVCHGEVGDWVALHAILVTANDFRDLTPEQKEARGMRNLRDPVKRTELCTSCHVGSQKEGKFVSHDMYAAGHPPLPSFEVAAFSDQMPRHWQYMKEKSPALQKELGLRKGELERTEMVLVGAVASFRDTMELLASQAEVANTTKEEDKQVLDLSNFDCYACHHGIRKPSWQEKRMAQLKPGWVPGRVPMRGWSSELIKLAIQHFCIEDPGSCAKLEKGFTEQMERLEKGFAARAFGSPAQIAPAARALVIWANDLAKKMHDRYPTAATTEKLLRKMPGLYNGKRLLDYDSAREVAWAFTTMYDELHGPKATPGADPCTDHAFGTRSGNAVWKTLQDIDKCVKLRLPMGKAKLIVEGELQDNLDRIKTYDARCFGKLFGELGPALGTGK